jgi:hypothetical protein
MNWEHLNKVLNYKRKNAWYNKDKEIKPFAKGTLFD